MFNKIFSKKTGLLLALILSLMMIPLGASGQSSVYANDDVYETKIEDKKLELSAVGNNLAFDKQVEYSGVEGGKKEDGEWKYPQFIGEMVVDGKTSTRWSPDREDSQYLTVDLGEIMSINKIVLDFAAQSPEYDVLVSNDDMEYIEVYSIIDGPEETGAIINIEFETVQARYVKFQQNKMFTQTENQREYSSSIKEFEIYHINKFSELEQIVGLVSEINLADYTTETVIALEVVLTEAITLLEDYEATQTVIDEMVIRLNNAKSNLQKLPLDSDPNNLAFDKQVEYSGVEGGKKEDGEWKYPQFIGEMAVDGKTGTRWSAEREDSQYLTVDLGEIMSINKIVLYVHAQSPDYDVLVSNDDIEYFEVYSISDGPEQESAVINIGFEEVEARYVKYQQNKRFTHSNGSLYGSSISEFKVYNEPEIIRIAEEIDNIPEITKGQSQLTYPEIPEGYDISIFSNDRPQVIDFDGNIHEPLVDAEIELVFKVQNEEDPENQSLTKPLRVVVPGTHTQNTGNKEPTVIPSLREWFGGNGDYKLTNKSRIVVNNEDKDQLANTAEFVNADIKDITGLDLDIVNEEPQKGDIYLVLDNTVKHLGDEGYALDIDDIITIKSDHTTGVFYGTRSILQILKQDVNHTSIPKGVSYDYPKYETRGLMLDVARKFYTIDFLKDYIELLAWYKMNTFHIHLNESVGGFRLESETHPEVTAKDGHYTKEEFRNLVILGMDYGINIIPEIDTPGHSGAFINYDPSLGSGSHLDISRPETVDFIKGLFDEYIDGDNPTFVGPDVHIGTDEYNVKNQEDVEEFRGYMDTLINYINAKDKKANLWAGLTEYSGTTPISNEATVDVWSLGFDSPANAINLGYDLINVSGSNLYIVPLTTGSFNDYLDIEKLYMDWDPTVWGGSHNLPYKHPNLKGAKFAHWNDTSYRDGITMLDSHDRLLPAIQVVAEKTWSEHREANDYNKFLQGSEVIDEAPGLNIAHKLSTENPENKIMSYSFENEYKDQSGNGYDGTGVKADIIEGKFGDGVKLNGGASYIKTPLRSLGFGSTVSMWIKPDTDNTPDSVLLESPEGQLKFMQGETGKLGISKEDYSYTFDYSVPKDVWTHIMLTGDNRSTTLYINGDEYVETLEGITFILPIEKIGSEISAFKGVIDNVIVKNKCIDLLEGRENIALEKNAGASGSEVDYMGPEKAVDGEISTRWSSKKTDDQWFTVDLGSQRNIAEVKIRWQSAYAEKYKILISNDNLNWKNVLENDEVINGLGGIESITFEPAQARYVKFEGIKRTEVNGRLHGYAFHEFEVYEAFKDLTEYNDLINEAEELLNSTIKGDPVVRGELIYLLNNYPYEHEEVMDEIRRLMSEFKESISAVNTSELEDKLLEANTIDTSLYTETSVLTLTEAIVDAEAVLANEEATQTEVDNAVAALTMAIENLEMVEAGDVTVKYQDEDGAELYDLKLLQGNVGENYITESVAIEGYELIETPFNAKGEFTEDPQEVVYVYKIIEDEVEEDIPLTPLEPSTPIEPEEDIPLTPLEPAKPVETEKDDNEVPDTGINTGVGLYTTTLATSLGGLLVGMRKRFKNK